jgi:hypothetical protein
MTVAMVEPWDPHHLTIAGIENDRREIDEL